MGLLGWWRRSREEKNRRIFRYWDGLRWRRKDPIEIMRALIEHPTFDGETDPVLAVEGKGRIALEASARCRQAVQEIFEAQPYNEKTGKGLTEGESYGLLMQFGEYTGALKKNGNEPPTSSVDTRSTSLDESTTKPSSDCTSTCPEWKPDKPLEC